MTGTVFQVTVTASSYAQLAGLLAGFAFSALIFLISTRITVPDPKNSFISAVRALIAAFLGLLLSSVGYAVLSGEPADARARNDSTEPILGVGFAVTGLLVLYAIVLTLDAAERLTQSPSPVYRQVSASTRHILAACVTPLMVFYIYLGVRHYETTRYGACHPAEPLDRLGVSLIIVQLAASWLLYPFMLGQRIHTHRWDVAVNTTTWTSRLLLLTTIVSAVAFAYTDAYGNPTQTVNPLIPAASMATITLASLGLTWQLAYTHEVP